jgi:arylsulfatase A-like enzyme
LHNFAELRTYSDIPKQGPIPDDKARELIRAYYAATSYTDAQVGKLLEALDRNGFRDNTIVILWGDHGWQLGEHGLWCKHSNFEIAARAPLILSAPKQPKRGTKTNALVEFVDVYPTLVELAGLAKPDGLEGASLVPLMENPDRTWKSAAFSQYPRAGGIMGHSMRTDRYRFTAWGKPGEEPSALELYDHQNDPSETENLAKRPDHFALVEKLRAQLKAGWRAALPQ